MTAQANPEQLYPAPGSTIICGGEVCAWIPACAFCGEPWEKHAHLTGRCLNGREASPEQIFTPRGWSAVHAASRA